MDVFLKGCVRTTMRNQPYLVMVFVQSVYAGMVLLSKASIAGGMNPYVFVVYRQALATLVLAPFAFYLERGQASPPLSCILLCKIFVASNGITIALNLFSFSLNFVSATFAAALANTLPALTFILAVCFGVERLSIKQRHGKVKLIGSMLSLSGALISTFARGPHIYPESHKDILHMSEQSYTNRAWIKGSLVVVAANAAYASWLIMQAPLIKQYPAKIRLTALESLFSCTTSAIWAVVTARDIESWKLGWNVNLLSVFYCGVIVTAMSFWLLVWVVEKRGAVFTAAFGPLTLIITAIFSAMLFQETFHWGSVCGAVLMVIGLYGILWAKSKEGKAETENRNGMVEGNEQKAQMTKATESGLV